MDVVMQQYMLHGWITSYSLAQEVSVFRKSHLQVYAFVC